MKRLFVFLILSVLILSGMSMAGAYMIPGVYSTGVNDVGALLPFLAPDPHYSLSSSISGNPPATATDNHPNWVPETSSSQWITPQPFASSSGSPKDAPPLSGSEALAYVYSLTFDLTGLDASTAEIQGKWATDNDSSIKLNNVDTGITKGITGFAALTDFSITAGFVAGINTLEFIVWNQPQATGNPTGLHVNIIGATAEAASVPEPAVMVLLGSGLAVLAGVRRKFRKR